MKSVFFLYNNLSVKFKSLIQHLCDIQWNTRKYFSWSGLSIANLLDHFLNALLDQFTFMHGREENGRETYWLVIDNYTKVGLLLGLNKSKELMMFHSKPSQCVGDRIDITLTVIPLLWYSLVWNPSDHCPIR